MVDELERIWKEEVVYLRQYPGICYGGNEVGHDEM
jgi:hypothetical protein